MLLARAELLQQGMRDAEMRAGLAGKRVAFIWDGEGFRNRAAFDLGVQLLGGVGVEIPVRLGVGEAIEDVAHYLDNWFDAAVIRTPRFETLTRFADAAAGPVINARTDHNHPCEILGDLAFIRATGRCLDGLRVLFVGEATNLCHSWCEAAAVLPIAVTQVCPAGFEASGAWWRQLVPQPAGRFEHSDELDRVMSHADVVYTDRWPQRSDGAEREAVEESFAPFQVTAELLSLAPPEALFLPLSAGYPR